MKRKDEELCKAAFNGLLLKSHAPQSMYWEDGDDPPDFKLLLDDRRFAVEVTGLVENIPIEETPSPSIGIHVTLDRFIKAVQAKAISRGILHGAYVVTMKPLDRFAQVKTYLDDRILDFIVNTYTLSDTSRVPIFGQGHQRIWMIQKVHDEKNYLSHVMFVGKWEGKAEEELCELMEERIDEKVEKLASITDPKVLLLLDLFHWVDSSSWHRCAKRIQSLSQFHTVCRVWGEHQCEVLYSIDPRWG